MLKFDVSSQIELLGDEKDVLVLGGRAYLEEFVTRLIFSGKKGGNGEDG